MPHLLIVEKNGNIKETNIKNYKDAELYKKAGLKNAEGFELHASWSAEINKKKYTVNLYGNTSGKATQENKYEFPPPVDSVLFFGSCILVNVQNNIVVDLTKAEWEQIYEYLFGGFDDLGDEDSDSAEDEDNELPKTKTGYAKDGFIVDDEIEDELDEDEDSEEEYKPVKKTKPAKSTKKKEKEVVVNETHTNNYLDCTSELTVEEYI